MKRLGMVLALAAMAAACGGGSEGDANAADTTGVSTMPAETGTNPAGTGTMTPPMDSGAMPAPGTGAGMPDSTTMDSTAMDSTGMGGAPPTTP